MHDEISSTEAGEEGWEKGDGKKQTWMHKEMFTCKDVHTYMYECTRTYSTYSVHVFVGLLCC